MHEWPVMYLQYTQNITSVDIEMDDSELALDTYNRVICIDYLDAPTR